MGGVTDSKLLYAPMPVGTLMLDGSSPYLGPAKVNATAVDLLGLCNAGPVDPDGSESTFDTITISCVNNYLGTNMSDPNPSGDYGFILEPRHAGRTIIHVANPSPNPPFIAEVMFTCPWCASDTHAYYGEGGGAFLERGFNQTTTTIPPSPPPYSLRQSNLTGLAWSGAVDANTDIKYWQEDTGCTPPPNLSVAGGQILGECRPLNSHPIQAGTVQATTWQPLAPGWNSVEFPAGDGGYIIITDPGVGAKIQMREGKSPGDCCNGFDGNIHHLARQSGQPAKAAVIHDTDRHLLVIPYGGTVTDRFENLAHMQHLRQSVSEEPRTTMRWLAHSKPGDQIYNGLFFNEVGAWPPYHVRLVEAEHISFRLPDFDIIQELLHTSNYTTDDQLRVMSINAPAGPLMDSEIYDIRNDKLLRTHTGDFPLWDGRVADRPYIQPWFNLQKNPVWETYGVTLPENQLAVVDVYATIPVVKPTHLSGTYLSSIPCGIPNPDEVPDRLRDAIFRAAHVGGYDQHLIEFLLFADGSGSIGDNLLLQHIYQASRTYLDYLDGTYLAGEQIHVPMLGNRPYLCTTIAPNVLESQYHLYAMPFGESYLSLGGREGTATATGDAVFGSIWNATYVHRAGVQSPRDGVVALDVTAGLGAAVSAFGMGDAGSHTTPTAQWANGTILVEAELTVGDATVDLATWAIDLHDIVEEEYALEDGSCYGRFVTLPDNSGYMVKTVTVAADLGEHIPVELELTATESPSGGGGNVTGASTNNLIVADDAEDTADLINISGPGFIDAASLDMSLLDVGQWTAINTCGGPGTEGGMEVILTAPSGNAYTIPAPCVATASHRYDITPLVAGEGALGPWTLTLDDNNMAADRWPGFVGLDSWGLELGLLGGMRVNQICDNTTSESIVVQFLLNTLVVDVR